MARPSAFVTDVLPVLGAVARNVAGSAARMTGVLVAHGDGAVGGGDGHFDLAPAQIPAVHFRHGVLGFRWYIENGINE